MMQFATSPARTQESLKSLKGPEGPLRALKASGVSRTVTGRCSSSHLHAE